MNLNKLNLLLVAGAAMCFTSCKILYIPNMVNAPLLKEQGELKVNLSTKDLQAAYAVSPNIGVMLNGYYNKNEWEITSGSFENKYESKRSLLEGGVGYFKAFGEKGVFDVYAGAGLGNLKYDYHLFDNGAEDLDESRLWSAKSTKFFLQPSIGMVKEKSEFAFSLRMVGLKFNNIDTLNYSVYDLAFENLNGIERPLYLFAEPAITWRFGIPLVKLQLQTLYSLKLNSEPLNTRNLMFKVGLSFNLSQFTVKKETVKKE